MASIASGWLTDSQKIGVGLTAFGVFFLGLGAFLWFDGGLMAIGNILFLAGITLVIGMQSTVRFFFKRPDKLRGTIMFFLGIFLVFFKWPMIGMIIEFIGFINLFGDFFPVIINFLQRLPYIGTVLSHPIIAPVLHKIAGSRRLPV